MDLTVGHSQTVEVSAVTALTCQIRHPDVIVSVDSCEINHIC